jgi:transcriptional regulator with XRE-family HTH domain
MFDGRKLARLLLDARERLGMSQVALAARAGVSQPSLSYYETGQAASLPEPGMADKLTRAYGVSLGDMLTAGGYKAETTERALERLALAEILRQKYHVSDVASLTSLANVMESAIRDIQANETAAKERGSGTIPKPSNGESEPGYP